MKKFSKNIISVVAVAAGLIIGLGAGQIQIKKEQKVFEDRIKTANKKMSMLQKKMEDERNEATVSQEQMCQGDLDKLQNEKKALGAQSGRLKEQTQKLEMKIKESDEAAARAKKESDEAAARAKKESDEAAARAKKEIQDLDGKLKKLAVEKQTLQAELKKTTLDLGQSESNNAKLCVIAKDLVKKYRDKGLGTILIEKEPLTQIKKVELEQLIRKYQEEIEQQKIKKNDAGGK